MTTKNTPYGVIHYGGPCKDDYDNIQLYDQGQRGWAVLKMQAPALRSLKDVEVAWAKRTTPWKKRRYIRVTGSHRTCAFQAECYARDPNRYAPPNVGLHTRGLAIDVYWRNPFQAVLLKRLLRHHGWNQTRPVDEPWHWSFGITG
jgi:hypothetical protein